MSSYSVKLNVSACAKRARLLQAVLEVVDDEHPSGAHEPRRLGGEQAYRAGAEHDDAVSLGDVAELRAEVAGRAGVGEQHGVLVVHPVRDQGRSDVGERHPDELRLPAVVAAAGVRVAVDAADGGGVGVDVVAVAVEPAGAEPARAAEDVEGHHDAVTHLQVLHGGPDLVDDADELVAERVADPGVRHHPVVEVQVGAADRTQRDAHDRVVGVLDRGDVLLLHADLVGAAVDHRAHVDVLSARAGPRGGALVGWEGRGKGVRVGAVPEHLRDKPAQGAFSRCPARDRQICRCLRLRFLCPDPDRPRDAGGCTT